MKTFLILFLSLGIAGSHAANPTYTSATFTSGTIGIGSGKLAKTDGGTLTLTGSNGGAIMIGGTGANLTLKQATVAITAVTANAGAAANTTQLTATNHGFTAGQRVEFSGFQAPSDTSANYALNSTVFTVSGTSLSANAFRIAEGVVSASQSGLTHAFATLVDQPQLTINTEVDNYGSTTGNIYLKASRTSGQHDIGTSIVLESLDGAGSVYTPFLFSTGDMLQIGPRLIGISGPTPGAGAIFFSSGYGSTTTTARTDASNYSTLTVAPTVLTYSTTVSGTTGTIATITSGSMNLTKQLAIDPPSGTAGEIIRSTLAAPIQLFHGNSAVNGWKSVATLGYSDNGSPTTFVSSGYLDVYNSASSGSRNVRLGSTTGEVFLYANNSVAYEFAPTYFYTPTIIYADGGISVGSGGTTITKMRHGVSGAMVLGTVTVTDTGCTANTRYFFTTHTIGTVTAPSAYYSSTRTASTSFVITSSQPTDTSTVAWFACEP